MRFLGIDFGTVRIGLATCDELQIVVAPLGTIAYSRAVFEQIAAFVRDEQIGALVVGIPETQDGSDTLTVRQARNFAARLRAFVHLPVYEWDESFSSKRATERMFEANVPRGRRREKGTTDAWAAAVILEEFLERERHSDGEK